MEQIGISDKTLLDRCTSANQIILSLEILFVVFQFFFDLLFQTCRQCFKRTQGNWFMVDHIAAEQLVRTFSGHDYLQLACCQFVYKPKGNCGRICQRLIHMILHFRQHCPVFFRCDHFLMACTSCIVCNFSCTLHLAVSAVVFCKSHGKRILEMSLCCNVVGIHTAGKQRTYLYITDLMCFDRFSNTFFDFLYDCFLILFFLRCQSWIKIAGNF